MVSVCRLMVHALRQRDLASGPALPLQQAIIAGLHDRSPLPSASKHLHKHLLLRSMHSTSEATSAGVNCGNKHDRAAAAAAVLPHMMSLKKVMGQAALSLTSLSDSALEMLSSMASSLCLLSFRLMMMRSNCVAAMYMAYLPAAPVLPEKVRAVSCTQLPGQSINQPPSQP